MKKLMKQYQLFYNDKYLSNKRRSLYSKHCNSDNYLPSVLASSPSTSKIASRNSSLSLWIS